MPTPAPIQVTENWSGRKMSFRPPWTAAREFVVTGTMNPKTALTAVDALTGLTIPKQLDEHPDSASLVALGPEITGSEGPDHFIIYVGYVYDLGGAEAQTDDPLTKPVIYQWDHMEVTEAVDIDLDGRPILNSAGDPLQGASRPIAYKALSVIRNEPTWNLSKNAACENKVNSAAITLGSGVTIAKEHMRCVSIGPSGQYSPGFRFLPILYKFEVIFDDSLGKYPFQSRMLDQGNQGWYSDSGTARKGKFTNGKGEIETDVRLDGSGKPLATPHPSTKVGEKNAAAIVNPNVVSRYDTDITRTDSTILYYKKSVLADFSILGL